MLVNHAQSCTSHVYNAPMDTMRNKKRNVITVRFRGISYFCLRSTEAYNTFSNPSCYSHVTHFTSICLLAINNRNTLKYRPIRQPVCCSSFVAATNQKTSLSLAMVYPFGCLSIIMMLKYLSFDFIIPCFGCHFQ